MEDVLRKIKNVESSMRYLLLNASNNEQELIRIRVKSHRLHYSRICEELCKMYYHTYFVNMGKKNCESESKKRLVI